MGFPNGSAGKESTCNAEMQETQVRSLGKEDTPEEGMATHCSILVGKISWTEELGGLQFMKLQRVRHG